MDLQRSASGRAGELTPDQLAVEKFAIGQSVPRTEDPMLLRGKGHYTDDVSLPGQAYAVIVRSQVAHGVIRAIDTAAAAKMPGVLRVYAAADLAGYGPLKCVVPFNNQDGTPMKKPLREALAKGKVRYVGDPVAYVVAETLLQPPKRSASISKLCRRSPRPNRPSATARHSFTTTCRITSRSTTISAMPRR
jgi:carbon-monoxide dehydrogenase large subunit